MFCLESLKMLRYILSVTHTWKCYPDIFCLVNLEVKHLEVEPFAIFFYLLPEFKVTHAVNIYWTSNSVLGSD